MAAVSGEQCGVYAILSAISGSFFRALKVGRMILMIIMQPEIGQQQKRVRNIEFSHT